MRKMQNSLTMFLTSIALVILVFTFAWNTPHPVEQKTTTLLGSYFDEVSEREINIEPNFIPVRQNVHAGRRVSGPLWTGPKLRAMRQADVVY